jgi:hypothetical protein
MARRLGTIRLFLKAFPAVALAIVIRFDPVCAADDVARMSSTQIKALQQNLTKCGCYRGRLDGIIGPGSV